MSSAPSPSRFRIPGWSLLAPVGLTLVVLAILAIEAFGRHPHPSIADPHHARVRAAVATIPTRFDLTTHPQHRDRTQTWIGVDKPIIPGARKLLRPNAILNREYENTETGEQLILMLIHCDDLENMAGHYPGRCYVNQGWHLSDTRRVVWNCGSRGSVHGSEYEFHRAQGLREYQQFVVNPVIMPNGRFADDLGEAERAASDPRKRIYGAGQIQLVFTQDFTEERRQKISEAFLEAIYDAIAAMRSGTSP